MPEKRAAGSGTTAPTCDEGNNESVRLSVKPLLVGATVFGQTRFQTTENTSRRRRRRQDVPSSRDEGVFSRHLSPTTPCIDAMKTTTFRFLSPRTLFGGDEEGQGLRAP